MSMCSAPIVKVPLSCFIIYGNSLFPPQRTSSTKHKAMPIALCSIVQVNIPLSSVDGKAPSLMNSSFNFRYQNLRVSARRCMHFCKIHTWFGLASFWGLADTVRSVTLPCTNPILTSNEFNVHLFDTIIEQVKQNPSLEQTGLSVRKFCASLKPLAHNLALINFPRSTNISLITHLTGKQSWPWSGTSSQTFSLSHCWNSLA